MADAIDIAAAWALLGAIFAFGYWVCYRMAGRDKWGALIIFGGAVVFSGGMALFRG